MFGDNRRFRLGKYMMTSSLRKERTEANPHIPKRGRRRNPGGVESSLLAQPQVVDPTSVHVYDTWGEGYDPTEPHYVDWPNDPYFQPLEVEDDEVEGEAEGEDQAATHVVPIVGTPFPLVQIRESCCSAALI